jgi:hypothetical protein
MSRHFCLFCLQSSFILNYSLKTHGVDFIVWFEVIAEKVNVDGGTPKFQMMTPMS